MNNKRLMITRTHLSTDDRRAIDAEGKGLVADEDRDGPDPRKRDEERNTDSKNHVLENDPLERLEGHGLRDEHDSDPEQEPSDMPELNCKRADKRLASLIEGAMGDGASDRPSDAGDEGHDGGIVSDTVGHGGRCYSTDDDQRTLGCPA